MLSSVESKCMGSGQMKTLRILSIAESKANRSTRLKPRLSNSRRSTSDDAPRYYRLAIGRSGLYGQSHGLIVLVAVEVRYTRSWIFTLIWTNDCS
jgi:hypothetical protein